MFIIHFARSIEINVYLVITCLLQFDRFYFLTFFCFLLPRVRILDVKLVLCILFVQIDRIRRHDFLCTEEKEVTADLVALVSSLIDPTRSMDLSKIFVR